MSEQRLTILAMPKPFRGHIGVIQRNAVRSWTRLRPRPEIYLFGDEEGVAQVAEECGIQRLPEIARNEFGTPLLDDLMRRARGFAGQSTLCYVNSDIILLQEFQDAVSKVAASFHSFLVVAHRLNVDVTESLQFDSDGERQPRQTIFPQGKPGDDTAIDVFAFSADTYEQVPSFAIGRAWFDQWLIKEARNRGAAVVDVTRVARAIHQNHAYGHIAGGLQATVQGEEAQRNLSFYGGVPHAYTLLDVTHELDERGRIRKVRLRKNKEMLRRTVWKWLVAPTAGFRRRVGLSRSALPKTVEESKP